MDEPSVVPHAFRFRVAYHGAGFAGWQRQPDVRTVQGELERAAAAVLGHPARVRGASRTDAGVHSMGQVAACDADGRRDIPARGFVAAMNAALPDDVAVRDAERVAPGYDPRFDAQGKHYRYLVHTGWPRDPLLQARVWRLGRALAIAPMRAATLGLLGTHDFRAFRSSDDGRDRTVRTLTRLDVTAGHADRADLVAIEVEGSAFLKNMVRILVGTLVEVGLGRRAPAAASLALESGLRTDAGITAPAEGLYLVEVRLGRPRPARP